MKKITILLFFMFIALIGMSQNNGYKCIYEEKIQFSQKMAPVDDPAIANAIMQALGSRKQVYTLTFANGKSLFEIDKENSAESFSPSDIGVVYVDMNKGEKITQEEFFGKKFLINEKLETIEWTITEETQNINGRNCIKATASDTTQIEGGELVAWFSTEIPIPMGPMGIVGLPGLIVKLDIGGMLIFELKDVKTVDNVKEIKAPKKGKKVTREEYNEIQKKKLEEFRSQRPDFGNGGMQIITM